MEKVQKLNDCTFILCINKKYFRLYPGNPGNHKIWTGL